MAEENKKNLFQKKTVAEQKADEIIMNIEESEAKDVDLAQIKMQAKRIKKTGNFLVDTFNMLNDKLQALSTIPIKTKVAYFQMLSVMINAGMPLTKSLMIIEAQEENKRFKEVINDLVDRVEGGESLSDAMTEHVDVFGEAEIGMIKSGEASGQLNSVLKDLSIQLEKNASIRAKIKGAMIYPVIIFLIMFAAVFVVMIMVVPPISQIFLESGKELPLPTKILIVMSEFTVGYWQYILMSMLAIVLGVIIYKKTEAGMYLWDKIMLKLPIFGPLLQKVILAQFSRNLGNMLASGIAIIKSLKIVGDSLGNEVYRLRLGLMSEDVSRGLKLADNMADSGDLFPPMLANMVAVGEQTAQLDTLTLKIADYYEEEVDNYVQNLMKMLEPIIMVVIGVVVGGLVAAIMLPIMDISSLSAGG
ncbi:type II secretion system F family protein [Patescibacteria group bacterium]|nr:type II secretion system F family protein [Patescibacteria group bacterium]